MIAAKAQDLRVPRPQTPQNSQPGMDQRGIVGVVEHRVGHLKKRRIRILRQQAGSGDKYFKFVGAEALGDERPNNTGLRQFEGLDGQRHPPGAREAGPLRQAKQPSSQLRRKQRLAQAS